MLPYFTEHFGNAASRNHAFGWAAEEAVEQARKQIAKLINADSKEIVFTSGATESDNLAVKGVLEMYKEKGDHIITSSTEHRAVIDTAKAEAEQATIDAVSARTALERRIEELRVFEREYRSRLRAYLAGQLRDLDDGAVIRRRRACRICGTRVTTYERAELAKLYVIKRSGERQEYDSLKLLEGLLQFGGGGRHAVEFRIVLHEADALAFHGVANHRARLVRVKRRGLARFPRLMRISEPSLK